MGRMCYTGVSQRLLAADHGFMQKTPPGECQLSGGCFKTRGPLGRDSRLMLPALGLIREAARKNALP